MGTIQEALRELKKQRRINEAKSPKHLKESKLLKEDQDTNDLYIIEDSMGFYIGDTESPSWNRDDSLISPDGVDVELGFVNDEEDAYKFTKAQAAEMARFLDRHYVGNDFNGDGEEYDYTIKPVTSKKSVQEAIVEESGPVDQDGDTEVLSFSLRKAVGESLNEEAGPVDQDGDIEDLSFNLRKFYQESCNKKEINESNDEETTASEPVNEFTVGAILSKFKDKDENAIVKVLPIDFAGQLLNINLSVDEDEEGNLTIGGTLTPIETKEENDIEQTDDTENVELEDEEELEEDLGSVDEDGDVEDLSFSLRDSYAESLNEAKDPEQKVTFENIRKLPGFDNVERKAAMAMVKYAKQNNDIDTIQDFKDFLDDNYGKIGVAIQMGNKLNSADFADLVSDDKKFADVITKICRKINWIDDNGYYVDDEGDGGRANAKKPSVNELIRNYIKLATKDAVGQKITYKILDKAYFDNDYSGLEKVDLK